MDHDQFFMKEALIQAKQAFQLGEVPVGAVIVYRGNMIARAHNQIETLQDATAHAEVLCIRAAAEVLGNWRLTGATLYSTLEPCSMCAGAIVLARLERLVWGAPDFRHGANGSLLDFFKIPHPIHRVEVCSGIFQEEAAQLMKDFFKQQRLCPC